MKRVLAMLRFVVVIVCVLALGTTVGLYPFNSNILSPS